MIANKEDIQIELAKRELARRRLSSFITYTYPSYIMGTFQQYLCDIIDEFVNDIWKGKSPRLIVTAPPRHGKSEILSRRLPAYLLGKYPDIQIINTSYSADLASKMNLDVQKIMDDPVYQQVFPNIKLPKRGSGLKRDSETFDIIGGKGGLRSAGVGGGITGMGANLFLIDDPVKDNEEAQSPTIQKKIVEWFNTTAYTRLMPQNGMIIIMTRWHLNDLVGYILEQQNSKFYEGNKFRIVNFPAIAEEDEILCINGKNTLFRKTGDPLHAERYSIDNLNSIRGTIGSYSWNALYQQHPVAIGGNIFKRDWFKFYSWKDTPRFDRMLVSWDMTFKDKKESDYVVGQVWGKKGSHFYLVEQVRFQGGFVAARDAVIKFHNKYPQAMTTLIEDKANGSAIIEVLRGVVSGILPVTPHESKQARAEAISPIVEAGDVYIPLTTEESWVEPFLDEVTSFPFAKHDDQMDCMTQALNHWISSNKSIWGRLHLNPIDAVRQWAM